MCLVRSAVNALRAFGNSVLLCAQERKRHGENGGGIVPKHSASKGSEGSRPCSWWPSTTSSCPTEELALMEGWARSPHYRLSLSYHSSWLPLRVELVALRVQESQHENLKFWITKHISLWFLSKLALANLCLLGQSLVTLTQLRAWMWSWAEFVPLCVWMGFLSPWLYGDSKMPHSFCAVSLKAWNSEVQDTSINS